MKDTEGMVDVFEWQFRDFIEEENRRLGCLDLEVHHDEEGKHARGIWLTREGESDKQQAAGSRQQEDIREEGIEGGNLIHGDWLGRKRWSRPVMKLQLLILF
ncbi:hypothetical protein Ancab_033881 [Ancistrocladus abbreviatus]